MNDILKLARIQLLIIILFTLFKFIRPSVLDSDAPNLFKIILLSLPNFFEGIVGVLTLTAILLYIRSKTTRIKAQIKVTSIYFIATTLSAIYVITQELKIHNLGGNNVFDTNDLLFSVVGLLTGYLIILQIQPKISIS
ncbi:hypothetical protein [uncultured Dokdonia sp.]|uniref:hypothetical protein n=1 Tax=uncultured Dokdonia sp. TaxID=575653 RepID=UPI0026334B70|nr:hypothetical protein [uncultured Dokdonia sp.]